MRGCNAAVELDVAAQVELVGDIIEVALGLMLWGKTLAPMPIFEQLLREGVAVGVALGIEAGPRITVPVPGAADRRTGFQAPHTQAEPSQLVKLIEPGDTGADDNSIER